MLTDRWDQERGGAGATKHCSSKLYDPYPLSSYISQEAASRGGA